MSIIKHHQEEQPVSTEGTTAPEPEEQQPIMIIDRKTAKRGWTGNLITIVPLLLTLYGVFAVALADTMADLAQGMVAVIVGVGLAIANAVRDVVDELRKDQAVYWNPNMVIVRYQPVDETEPADDVQPIDVGAGGDWAGVPTPAKDEAITPPERPENVGSDDYPPKVNRS